MYFFTIMFYCVYGQMFEIENYYYYYYYYKLKHKDLTNMTKIITTLHKLK